MAVHTLNWWTARYPPPGTVFGAILAAYYSFLAAYRVPAIGLNAIESRELPLAYTRFGQLWPALQPRLAAARAVNYLKKHCRYLKGIVDFYHDACCGKLFDRTAANPMFPFDVRRIARSCPYTPTGTRMAAFLVVAFQVGARGLSFILSRPTNAIRNAADGTWKIEYPPVKQSSEINLRPAQLDAEASSYMDSFIVMKSMKTWNNSDTLFCFSTVEDIVQCLNEAVVNCGYPNWYFGSRSTRVGFVTKIVVESILGGASEAEGLEDARAQGGWSCHSNALKHYLNKDLVVLAKQKAGLPAYNSIDSFNLTELHPDLERVPNLLQGPVGARFLPGPFRNIRYCSNDGEPQDFRQTIDSIWVLVRDVNHDLVNLAAYGNGGVVVQCSHVGRRIFQIYGGANGQLPASWNAALAQLRHMHAGAANLRSVGNARARLVNVLIRSKTLTLDSIANNNFAPIPPRMMANFVLFERPPGAGPYPERPKPAYNCIRSVNMPSLRLRQQSRIRTRVDHVVHIHGHDHRVEDLTAAQALLLQNNNPRPTLAAWNHAATLP